MRLRERIGKLESAIGAQSEGLPVIIISIVWADNGKPAAIQPEPIGASLMGRDWTLNRELGETVDDFIVRVEAVAPRGSNGVATILLTYPEDDRERPFGG